MVVCKCNIVLLTSDFPNSAVAKIAITIYLIVDPAMFSLSFISSPPDNALLWNNDPYI